MKHICIRNLFVLLVLSSFLSACGPDEPMSPGKRIYVGNCAMCHTMDPTRGGPRGPAVAGASVELLERKLLDGKYPKGYEPKRRTALMPRFPGIKPFIHELAEYLNGDGRSP